MQLFFGIIFWIAVAAIIYSWKKSKAIQQENLEDFESNEEYQKFSKMKKIAIAVCVVSFVLCNFIETDEDKVRETASHFMDSSVEIVKKLKNIDSKYKIKSVEINGNHAYVKFDVEEYLNGKKLNQYDMDMKLKKYDDVGWSISNE